MTERRSYAIASSSDRSKTGVVHIERRGDGSAHVVVQLGFTVDEAGGYDFHIHNLGQAGNIVVRGEVNRRTGSMDIAVLRNAFDGTPLDYDTLTRIDGYAAVHETRHGDLYGDVGRRGNPL